MLINIHTHHISSFGRAIYNSDIILSKDYFTFGKLSNDYFQSADSTMNIEAFEDTYSEIFTHKNCVGVGEIGLDKNISVALDKQIELFTKQLIISEKYKLPVLLHCVKSWNEIVKIKKELSPQQPWIFHGFRKTNLLESVLSSGTYISIGTAILRDKKLQDCVSDIPLESMFLETDNDTQFTIEDVYKQICLIKNLSLHTLENQVLKNTKKVFQKWEIG